ncbi:putative nuclear serine protease HtrA2/Nma111 [Stachybotrys elegans]|uniref:Pro-apoptotic serine protease NMA111 n=1 Tax=Stachybotrys elegans TaxID=80388 RepID=A0A8K0WJV9_9HYPO|nr:putative nuclear serine protease HtrA2/Nma111 [Stachybotrys elegans]
MNRKRGQTRPKRKASPNKPQLAKRRASERPSKEDSPDVDLPDQQDKTSNLAADPMLCSGMPGGPEEWKDTIKRVASSVVAIRFSHPQSFDVETAITGEATCFVVDAKRGYVLTNRHVVGAGPFWGYCVFENHEEVQCYPLYRDPVHDFGILRYNTEDLKYMQANSLDLRPDQATVGIEIRIGIISRLDRNAPEYSKGYNDFNTCYYQASAAATGGSSGSPVIAKDGSAVALQASGRTDKASTDFFLPLDRPLRALQCIQQGKPVTRGDIQCQFLFKPFDECRRLGLSPKWEAAMRQAFPYETNMLVAEIVLPMGPSDGKIKAGDVLIKVNGDLLTQFIRLDDIMDRSVGMTVKILLQRGGKDVEVDIEVGDLHKITPDRFVTVAGANFHDLSYQQARRYAIPVQGVFLCGSAGSFPFKGGDDGLIIQTIDHKNVPNLNTFIKVMKDIPDKARVVITYLDPCDLNSIETGTVYLDRHWSAKMIMAIRNDKTGLWDFNDLGSPLPPAIPQRQSASFIELGHIPHPKVAELIRSFVYVTCVMPIKLDGFIMSRRSGMGLVIDAEKGLVLISRAIIPHDLCDITVSIADTILVEGKVVFLHPLQNYAVIQYDSSLVDAPIKSARLSDKYLQQGAKTYFVGYNRSRHLVHGSTNVTQVRATTIPFDPEAPRYRPINTEVIEIDSNLGGSCNSGILVASNGTVQALWLSHPWKEGLEWYLGIGTPSLLPVIEAIQKGVTPKLRILPVEFHAIPMCDASVRKVSNDWTKKLFMVIKCASWGINQPIPLLKEGDIILTLNGRTCTTISDLYIMYSEDILRALIVRDGKEIELEVQTVPTEDIETDHAVSFCGALFHRPHQAVFQETRKLHSEVYISSRTQGSPAYQYGVEPTNFITHVNGQSTPDLKSFIEEIRKIPDNTYFRLNAVTLNSAPWVITMKNNEHYFPTVVWLKDTNEPCGWRQIPYGGNMVSEGEAIDSSFRG